MNTTTGVRRRDVLAVGGAAAALAPLAGLANGVNAAQPRPTLWWAPDDDTPLRTARRLRPAATAAADLRLTVDGRSGSGAPAALALRHPSLPDLWHTVWADAGAPGGAPAGVTVRLSPDARGALHLVIATGDAEHPMTLGRSGRDADLRPGRWVVALPSPRRPRPRLTGRTAAAASLDPTCDLLLLRIESDASHPLHA